MALPGAATMPRPLTAFQLQIRINEVAAELARGTIGRNGAIARLNRICSDIRDADRQGLLFAASYATPALRPGPQR
jgi:hypothetical protein